MATQTQTTPLSDFDSATFILNSDERSTTISSLLNVIRHAVHSNSGELQNEERDSISWCIYFIDCLVLDDRKINRQKAVDKQMLQNLDKDLRKMEDLEQYAANNEDNDLLIKATELYRTFDEFRSALIENGDLTSDERIALYMATQDALKIMPKKMAA
jgi:hypothetical protein